MLQRIIEFSLRHAVIVLLGLLVLAFLGVSAITTSPKEFLPDLSSPMISVLTEKPGLAPQEVEALITRPLENSLQSLPNVVNVRSESSSGLSLIVVTFKWGTDYYLARQLVTQSLSEVAARLPAGTDPPFLTNAASRLGEVIEYYVRSDSLPIMDVREAADYDIRLRLLGVSGVARVTDRGGEVREFQVLVDQDRLRFQDIGLDEITFALRAANLNFSGGVLTQGPIEYSVRGLARLNAVRDLAGVVIASRKGVPVFLKDLAEIREGPQLRRGIVTVNGREAVLGTVAKQYGADSEPVINGLLQEIKDLKPFLPPSLEVRPFFNQGELIGESVSNLRDALLIGGLAVLVVVILFLASLRTGIIIAVTLPVSVVVTFVFMKLFHITVNVMSLGGIAVGLGIMIDAAIVDTENIFRWLRLHPADPFAATLRGAVEVRRPVAYSTAIIVAVFAPLMFLSGFEGKLFGPFAFTIIVSMLVGFALSVTLTPVLCYRLLRRSARSTAPPAPEKRENLLTRAVLRVYAPVLGKALKRPLAAAAIVLAVLVLTILLVPFIGSELLPPFDENALLLLMTLPPGTSLDETIRVTNAVVGLCQGAPDVLATMSKIGRGEGGEETDETVNFSETFFILVDRPSRTKTIAEITDWLRKKVEDYPGIVTTFLTPLNDRIEETISGTKGDLAVSIYGGDLDILSQRAEALGRILEGLPGVKDVAVQQTAGLPLLNVLVDREEAGRFGLTPEHAADVVETALAGSTATTILRDVREYRVLVRLQDRFRDDPDKIGNVLIDTPSGVRVKLSQVARIWKDTGPMMIGRENRQRRVQVTCNVAGGRINDVVSSLKARLGELDLPQGYAASFGGNYARQRDLTRQIATMVVISLLVVFMLLVTAFSSVWQAVLLIFTIPLALMGGVWALFLTAGTFNVSALIGFVAHFGLTVQKGVILIEYINEKRKEGLSLPDALLAAGRTRMRPVIMTALAASLCVLPLALGMGAGAEIQQPMAVVLIGGLMVSTPIVLVILPALYGLVGRIARRHPA